MLALFAYTELFAQLGYRCQGKFIHLTPNVSGRYYVQTRNPESKAYLEKIVKNEYKQDNNKRSVFPVSDNSFFVSSKSQMTENDYISEQFLDSRGNSCYILPRIIMALKTNVNIDDLIKGYTGILTPDSIQRLNGMITFTCSLSSAKDVLRIASEIDTYSEVEWCNPDMISNLESHEYNPLFPMQYYLQSNTPGNFDIKAVPAWGIITGSNNVTVAVIDDGVDPDHEDLIGNVLQGYTIGDATGYGKPKNENEYNYKGHGMACAGIIGAQNNEKGILGVAYGVNILPVNIITGWAYGEYINGEKRVRNNGFTASDSELAYAIQWAAERADILSISYGSNTDINAVITVINNAITNGRNGKGCVVVASSGNDYPSETTIKFPARMNGVIAVGAIDMYGSIHDYSQRGSELDLVAPSGLAGYIGDVVTTDRMGTLGYNPYESIHGDLADKNYTSVFGGTSAACPQVAGVAALLLSINPNLTVNEVRSILQTTARKLPAMNGLNRTDTYGYGLVDAYAAVLKAFLNISGSYHVCSTETYTIPNLPSGAIVHWSVSNSKLSLVSGQGTGTATFQKNSNGECVIAATIVIGTSTLTLTKNVWAGSPTAPTVTGWPHTNLFMENIEYDFIAHGNSQAQILEYQWTVIKGATLISGGNSTNATFLMNSPGPVSIRVRARNACGWGPYTNKSGGITDDNGLIPIKSPGNNIVSIPLSGDGEYEIQLWNTNRMIRSTKTTKSSYDVDLSNLPSDLYIIKVLKDGQNFNQMKVKK